MNLNERIKYEAEFFNKRIQEYGIKQWNVPENAIPNKILEQLGILDLKNKKVLDCGCGTGQLSVFMAKKGANVFAIDVSAKAIEITKERARRNGVKVDARVMPLECLKFPDNFFDLVVGQFVLHHVLIDMAAKEIYRVLKKGGKAIFEENTSFNKLLMFCRQHIVGRFGIKKLRDEIEHPLTYKDIKIISKIFHEKCYCHYFTFIFFRLADDYIFQHKIKPISFVLSKLDKLVYSCFPFLRKYSYYIVIELQK